MLAVLTAEHLATLSAGDAALDMTTDFAEDAIRRRHTGVAVLIDRAIASYCWLSVTETVVVEGLVVRPAAGSCYVYKAFTAPRYRGTGLLGACLRHASRIAAEELGAERLVT